MIKHNFRQHSLQYGVTLVELMTTVTVLAILVAAAVPSYLETIEKRRLRGAAETLYGELQYAKMEAIKTNTPVRVDFTVTSTSSWCYGISTSDCDCTTSDSCTINGVERVVRSTDYNNISVDATSASPPWGSGGASFSPIRSSVTSGGATFYSDHYAVRVTTSGLGKVKICNATGMPKADFGGYPSC